jgi:ribosomal protein L32
MDSLLCPHCGKRISPPKDKRTDRRTQVAITAINLMNAGKQVKEVLHAVTCKFKVSRRTVYNAVAWFYASCNLVQRD